MKWLSIGQIAKQAGVGVETVRFYERRGLLAEPNRKASGYRQYDESAVARLQFIRRTKELGFRLSEVQELLGLWFDAETNCCDARRIATAKIAEIDERIESLQTMKQSLTRIIRQCERSNLKAECRLFGGLEASILKPVAACATPVQ